MINSNINDYIDQYKKIYSNDKIIVIKDFLREDIAEKIYNYMHFQKRKDTWISSVCFNNIKSDVVYKDSKKKHIKNNQEKANAAFSINKFSFSFQRTINNNKIRKPNIEDFTKFLFKREDIINLIKKITSENITKSHDIFMSKYRYGDFLSPHCDKNNGRIAFVLNMTKNWKPHYGGILHIMNQERSEIIKSVIPNFNSLVLFYIPDVTGIPHFVSHVSVQGKYRYAITGWFS